MSKIDKRDLLSIEYIKDYFRCGVASRLAVDNMVAYLSTVLMVTLIYLRLQDGPLYNVPLCFSVSIFSLFLSTMLVFISHHLSLNVTESVRIRECHNLLDSPHTEKSMRITLILLGIVNLLSSCLFVMGFASFFLFVISAVC